MRWIDSFTAQQNSCFRDEPVWQQDEDEEPSQQSKGGLGGLFGGRSKAAADAPTGPQKQKKIDAKLVDAKPVGKEVSLVLEELHMFSCCLYFLFGQSSARHGLQGLSRHSRHTSRVHIMPSSCQLPFQLSHHITISHNSMT